MNTDAYINNSEAFNMTMLSESIGVMDNSQNNSSFPFVDPFIAQTNQFEMANQSFS